LNLNSVDYSRVLQPQADAYDVDFFLALKAANGFVRRDFPEMRSLFDQQVKIGGWRSPPFHQEVPCQTGAYYALLESASKQVAPVYFGMIAKLLDVLTCIDYHSNLEQSGLCPTARYPGAWIVLTSINEDPAVALGGIMHELMHQKLITLGFGTHQSFLDTGDEFIFNDKQQLHHSIVNSYADTMQPYMSAPVGRPMAACIHGYASFLAVAATTLKFVKHDARRAPAYLRSVKKWTDRMDESWKAIVDGAQPSRKGEQLLEGLGNWTREHLLEYRTTVQDFSDGRERQAA
jgi:hypothetical protein